MPDRDGIEYFSNGRFGCAWCQAAQLTWEQANEHRRRCGRRWRATYGPKRTRTREEQIVMEAIARGVEE